MELLKTDRVQLAVWKSFLTSDERFKFDYFAEMKIDEIEKDCIVEGLWIDQTLVGLALLHPNQDLNYQAEIKDYCVWKYGNEDVCSELLNYLDEILPSYQSGMEIKYLSIHEDFQGLRYGSWWIEQLKQKYPSLLLYSDTDVEDFWEKQGVTSLVLDYYVYPDFEPLNKD